jgi:hypothetical protein
MPTKCRTSFSVISRDVSRMQRHRQSEYSLLLNNWISRCRSL